MHLVVAESQYYDGLVNIKIVLASSLTSDIKVAVVCREVEDTTRKDVRKSVFYTTKTFTQQRDI